MNGSYAHGKCQVQWVWDKQRDPLPGTVNFNFFWSAVQVCRRITSSAALNIKAGGLKKAITGEAKAIFPDAIEFAGNFGAVFTTLITSVISSGLIMQPGTRLQLISRILLKF